MGRNHLYSAAVFLAITASGQAASRQHLCYDLPNAPDSYCFGFSAPLIAGTRLQLKALKQINANNKPDQVAVVATRNAEADTVKVSLQFYEDFCLSHPENLKQGSPVTWENCDSPPSGNTVLFNATEFDAGNLVALADSSFKVAASFCNRVLSQSQEDGFFCDNLVEKKFATLDTDPFPWSGYYVNMYQGSPDRGIVGATSGETNPPTSTPTLSPSQAPTGSPTTATPTTSPTLFPTSIPTASPVRSTKAPTDGADGVGTSTETPRVPPSEVTAPLPSGLDVFQIAVFAATLVLMLVTTSLFSPAAYGRGVNSRNIRFVFPSVGFHHVFMVGGAVAVGGTILRFHDLPVLAGEFFGSFAWVVLLLNIGMFDSPKLAAVVQQPVARRLQGTNVTNGVLVNVSDSFDKYAVFDGELVPTDVIANTVALLCIVAALCALAAFALRLFVNSGDTCLPALDFAIGLVNRFSFYLMLPALLAAFYQLQLSPDVHPGRSAGMDGLAGVLIAYSVLWTLSVSLDILKVPETHWNEQPETSAAKDISPLTVLSTRYGSFVLSLRYGARMFWLAHVVLTMVTAAVAGAVRDSESGAQQLVALLAVHAVYAVLVGLVRPFRDSVSNVLVTVVITAAVIFYGVFLALANDTITGEGGPLPVSELPDVSDVGHAVSIVVKVVLVMLLVLAAFRAFQVYRTRVARGDDRLEGQTDEEMPQEDGEEETQSKEKDDATDTKPVEDANDLVVV